MGGVFSAGHGLKFAKPSRIPPDPTLFPNYLQNYQGLWLRFSEWRPHGAAEVKGVVFLVPGLGEHAGRYDSVALRLTQAGYAVFSVNNQGSGGSEGVRLYVERFSHFVDDVHLFIRHIADKYPELAPKPRFILGHSLGGVITILAAMRDPKMFKGVVLSGPGLQPPQMPKTGSFLHRVVRCLANCVPKLKLAKLNVDGISSNRPVVELAQQDPYYSGCALRARFISEFISGQQQCFDAAPDPSVAFPFLLVHGKGDPMCSPEGSERFFALSPSTDKAIRMYDGALHEVLTDTCRKQVLDDILEFINKRCT